MSESSWFPFMQTRNDLGHNVIQLPASQADLTWGVVGTIHYQRPDWIPGIRPDVSNPMYQMVNGVVSKSGIMLESERST